MTAIPQQQHLDLIDHMASLTAGNTSIQAALASNLPQDAATTHYSVDGKTKQSNMKADFSQLHAKNGKIIGGQLKSTSVRPDGWPLHDSNMSFGSHGAPVAAAIDVKNRFTTGDFHKISLDFSKAVWSPGLKIDSGHIQVKTQAPDGSIKHEGKLSFAAEVPQAAAFTYYEQDGSRAVSGYTDVDYSKVNFIGSQIMSGKCTIVSKFPNQNVRAHSAVSFLPGGQVLRMMTTNHDAASGAIKHSVLSDFSKAVFNPQNKIDSGTVSYEVSTPNGLLLSRSNVDFATERPSISTTEKFKERHLHTTVKVDFSQAKFNNNLNIISSFTLVEEADAKGNLLSKSKVEYDVNGHKVRVSSSLFSPADQELTRTVVKDYSQVCFNQHGDPISGKAIIVTTAPGCKATTTEKEYQADTYDSSATDGMNGREDLFPILPNAGIVLHPGKMTENTIITGNGTSMVTKTVKRSDGTLLSRTDTTMVAGKPTIALVVQFGPDGHTVVSKKHIDLGQVSYAPSTGTVSGTVGIKSFDGGQKLHTVSQLNY